MCQTITRLFCGHAETIDCGKQCGVNTGTIAEDGAKTELYDWCKIPECQADKKQAERQMQEWQAGENAKKAAQVAQPSNNAPIPTNAAHTGMVGKQHQRSNHHGRFPEQSETLRRQEEPATAEQSSIARSMALSCVGLGGHLPALSHQSLTSQSNGRGLTSYAPHPQMQAPSAALAHAVPHSSHQAHSALQAARARKKRYQPYATKQKANKARKSENEAGKSRSAPRLKILKVTPCN